VREFVKFLQRTHTNTYLDIDKLSYSTTTDTEWPFYPVPQHGRQRDRIESLHLPEQPVTAALLRDPIKEISCITRHDNSKLLANVAVELLANAAVQLFFTAQRFISRAIGRPVWRSSHL